METIDRKLENNSEAGRWLSERLPAGSSERRMVEWLSQALDDPAITAARYFRYRELEQKANWIIIATSSQPREDKTYYWLRDNYYFAAKYFYWSMATHCYDTIYPEAIEFDRSMITSCYGVKPDVRLSDINYPDYAESPHYDLSDPEFILDSDEVRATMVDDQEKRRQTAADHSQSEERIRHLCAHTLKELPEEAEIVFGTPLRSLASMHRSAAHCADFSRMMLHG
ncbi:hypothetical protein F4X86_03195 [Candidatus Saccharibacteria bacterium]|nr:hypothetical protein [Candidatus Saccharibacteria bacterium]